MKSIVYVSFLISVFLMSCGKESGANQPSAFISESMAKIEPSLISKLDAISLKSKDEDWPMAITFWVVMDRTTEKIKFSNFEEQGYVPLRLSEGSIFPLFSNFFGLNLKPSDKFVVSCTGGEKGNWSQNCSGKFSCGTALYNCLKQGGCGSICKESDRPTKLIFNGKQFLENEESLILKEPALTNTDKDGVFGIGEKEGALEELVKTHKISIVEVSLYRDYE